MKKKVIILTGLIALILLASNLLAAANLKAQAKASTNELKGGEEVTITLNFSEYQQIKDGLNAYQATLEYNKDIFEEVKQEDFQCLNDWEKLQYNQATGEFVAIKKVGSTEPEDIVSVTLRTKPVVKATTTEIKIKDIITSEGERYCHCRNKSNHQYYRRTNRKTRRTKTRKNHFYQIYHSRRLYRKNFTKYNSSTI